MSWLNDNAAEANRRLDGQARFFQEESVRKHLLAIREQLTELAELLQELKTRLEGDGEQSES